MNNTATTFWKYLNENKIEIPIIQRDYAQGRIGKEELRKSFLGDLKTALDESLKENSEYKQQLDFVYGSTQNGKINPLDGQQRLTTLWLLHWYIALKARKLEENKETFKKFSYETRVSSREFIQRLCEYKNNPKNGKLVSDIQNQTWFYSEWKQDPTIQSMLRMLSGTTRTDKTGNDIVDGIEELFKDTDPFSDYWNKLIVQDSKTCPIVFYSLNLGELKLTDDLYIKMNARGEQLTSFENFKADLVGYIKEQKWDDLLSATDGIPIKMDTTWTDIFWKNKSNNKIDKIYFAFLNRYFLNVITTQKDNGTLLSAENMDKNEKFKRLYEKENEYSSFEYYKFDISVFNNLKKTLDNFAVFLTAPEQNSKRLDEIQKLFYPAWEKESKFRFIPEYNDDGTISTLTQPQRVVFFAICKFFEKCAYLEKCEYFEAYFNRWMRVVWNLVENANIDTIPAMIGNMRLIDELSEYSHDIYKFLAGDDKISSTANKDQVAEEREKAKKIQDKNGEDWEKDIKKAEAHLLLKGKIRVLFDNHSTSIDDFKKRFELFEEIYIKEPGTYYFIKVVLSKLEYEESNPPKIDLKKGNWKTLLNGELYSAFQKIEKNEISPNPNVWINQIVSTNLLEKSRGKIVGPYNGKVILWGTEGCRWVTFGNDIWGNVILGTKVENRNSILSELVNSKIEERKIYTNQKIEGCNFFWGWDINFEYKGNNFQWNRYGKIYLMKGEIIDKSKSIDGNNMTENDFVDKLKGLINSTNNPEKSI